MALIVFSVNPHDKIHGYIHDLVREAGGSMPLEDLVEKFERRFQFFPHIIEDELLIHRSGLKKKAFRLENGVVFLP